MSFKKDNYAHNWRSNDKLIFLLKIEDNSGTKM